MLRLYVDTASRAAAEPLLATGVFHGLTTNPTLIEREGLESSHVADIYGWATASGAEEVFLQAWGDDADAMQRCAEQLQSIGPKVVVKVPVTPAGTAVAARLSVRGQPVLLTAVYNAAQALLAGATGAAYVAPYLGRMHDAGRDGTAEVLRMHRALAASGSRTRVLVASIRDLDTVVALAEQGVSCFALSPEVARGLFDEPLTHQAVEVFDKAARRAAP
ncbi:MAG: transaldolase [Nitriliruptorales bacterium]|nr:transaldolase [Nitriliruptorales bacterium]